MSPAKPPPRAPRSAHRDLPHLLRVRPRAARPPVAAGHPGRQAGAGVHARRRGGGHQRGQRVLQVRAHAVVAPSAGEAQAPAWPDDRPTARAHALTLLTSMPLVARVPATSTSTCCTASSGSWTRTTTSPSTRQTSRATASTRSPSWPSIGAHGVAAVLRPWWWCPLPPLTHAPDLASPPAASLSACPSPPTAPSRRPRPGTKQHRPPARRRASRVAAMCPPQPAPAGPLHRSRCSGGSRQGG